MIVKKVYLIEQNKIKSRKNEYINNYNEFDFEIKKSNPYFKKISFKII